MTHEDPVVQALRRALAEQRDRSLLLTLGRRLMELTRHEEALGVFRELLTMNPADSEGLDAAAAAAEATGDHAAASGYRTLLQALGHGGLAPAEPSSTPSVPLPVRLTTSGDSDTGRPALRLVGEEEVDETSRKYRHVRLSWDLKTRIAELEIDGPTGEDVELLRGGAEAIHAAGDEVWALRAYRELDDALLHLRVNLLDIGLVLVRLPTSLVGEYWPLVRP